MSNSTRAFIGSTLVRFRKSTQQSRYLFFTPVLCIHRSPLGWTTHPSICIVTSTIREVPTPFICHSLNWNTQKTILSHPIHPTSYPLHPLSSYIHTDDKVYFLFIYLSITQSSIWINFCSYVPSSTSVIVDITFSGILLEPFTHALISKHIYHLSASIHPTLPLFTPTLSIHSKVNYFNPSAIYSSTSLFGYPSSPLCAFLFFTHRVRLYNHFPPLFLSTHLIRSVFHPFIQSFTSISLITIYLSRTLHPSLTFMSFTIFILLSITLCVQSSISFTLFIQ